MRWNRKAIIQNFIALLPTKLSNVVYYFLQRNFGGLREVSTDASLMAAKTFLDYISENGKTIESASVLEIGTGRRLVIPIALWLCGSSRITTVDLNPYLKPELVYKDLTYLKLNAPEIITLFGVHCNSSIFRARYRKLMQFDSDLDSLFRLMNIDYSATADAASLSLPSKSVDYHLSYSVFEHVPPNILKNILIEGKRLIKKDGLFIHWTDMSDHFSHADGSISCINFLRFAEDKWKFYAGNRYMYQNRLRIDDFYQLYEEVGLNILAVDSRISRKALHELRNGFPLDELFKHKSNYINATTSARIIASLFNFENLRRSGANEFY